jgi:hypothetical protein
LCNIPADRRGPGALRGAQLGGARAGVRGKFLVIRDDRLARQHGEARRRLPHFRLMPRTGDDSAALGKKRLHHAVLERVKRDDHETAAGPEHAFGRRQRRGELAELVVHEHAQRLERARRRMHLARPRAHDLFDDVGERKRRRDWRCGSRPRDRARDVAGKTLLAERRDDLREVALGGRIDEIGRARPGAAHAHVERPVVAEREAAFGLIELHRGDAEIEQDAIDRVMAEIAGDLPEIGEAIFDKREPACGGFDQVEAARDRAAVAVDADHARARDLQDRAGVSAGAERTVDVDAAFARVERVGNLTSEHGNVTGRSASDSAFAVAARHHSRALCASCAATREPSCFFNARTVPVASASCARKRPGSQI